MSKTDDKIKSLNITLPDPKAQLGICWINHNW